MEGTEGEKGEKEHEQSVCRQELGASVSMTFPSTAMCYLQAAHAGLRLSGAP